MKVFVFVFSLLAISCASHEGAQVSKAVSKAALQKVFFYPYDIVWRAAQMSLKYPTTINNQDTGIIETDYIKSIEGWQSPIATKAPPSGQKYKITLVLVKGIVNGKESVRVTVVKKIENQKDFFSDPVTLESDGQEESVILYRIERELSIEDAIKKAAK